MEDRKSKVDDKVKKARAELEIYFRRIAPCEESRKMYENDMLFLDDLTTFVKDGLNSQNCIVVIASTNHLAALEIRLREEGFNIFYLTLRDQYIPLDAEILLEKFMVNKSPDEVLFRHLVMTLGSRILKNDRNIRAFSEMAALLWLRGQQEASLDLERMWAKLIETTPDYDYVTLKSEILPIQSAPTVPAPPSN